MKTREMISTAQLPTLRSAVAITATITAILFFTVSCTNTDTNTDTNTEVEKQTVSGVQTFDGLIVSNSWARIADSAGTGGAYVTLINSSGEDWHISGLSSPVADTVELHETAQHDGVMHMMPIMSAKLTAGDSIVMKPGGTHLMFIRLHHALTPGDSVPVTLHFEDRAAVSFSIPVRTP